LTFRYGPRLTGDFFADAARHVCSVHTSHESRACVAYGSVDAFIGRNGGDHKGMPCREWMFSCSWCRAKHHTKPLSLIELATLALRSLKHNARLPLVSTAHTTVAAHFKDSASSLRINWIVRAHRDWHVPCGFCASKAGCREVFASF
jgi:hypothetical protein